MNGRIENICFRIGGFYGYDYFSVAVNKDGTATLYHESVNGSSMFPNEKNFSKLAARHFLETFERTGVFRWKRYYSSDDIIMDGTQWKVEIKRTGKRLFVREGSNMYPTQWDLFCRLFGIGLDAIKTVTLELQAYINNHRDEQRIKESITIDFKDNKLTAKVLRGNDIDLHFTFMRKNGFGSLENDLYTALEQQFDDESFQTYTENIPFYKLSVVRYDGTNDLHNGIYDKNHLSDMWIEVINSLQKMLPASCDLWLLNTYTFKDVHGKNDLIFYSVEVEGTDNDYYYFSHDESLNIGDLVTVPFGRDNALRQGKIIDISYFPSNELPFPIEKMKYIADTAGKNNTASEKTVFCPVLSEQIDGGDCMIISDVADGYIKASVLWGGVVWNENQKDKCIHCKYHEDRECHIASKNRKINKLKLDFTYKDVIDAHEFCGANKQTLTKDTMCGCVNCLKIYDPKEITEYIIDNNACDRNGTAVCPYCGVDSVIGESSGYPITKEFLTAMNKKWF